MNAYTPYPAYKDNGIEWLGQLPVHWDMRRLKFVAGVNPPKTEVSYLPGDLEVSFLPMERVGYGTLDLELKKPLKEVKQGFTYFRDGDVLVAKITPSFENGKGALAFGLENGIGFGTTELHVIRATPEIDQQFLFYLTFSHQFRGMGETQMYGTAGQKRVPDWFINNFPTPLPPLPEQRAIAAFLDRETAHIDTLIVKKRELIDLLQQQRTAVISHAVTKGLDTAVPLKDSGIEWLGQIPAHWDVIRLKFISSIRYGLGQPPPQNPDGIPFIRATNISKGRITDSDLMRVENTRDVSNRNARLVKGEIIVVRSGAYTGDSAIVPEEFDGAIAGYDMVVNVKGADSPFLAWQLLSPVVRDYQFGLDKLRAAQPHLNVEQLGNTQILLSPLPEQRAIAAFLDRETVRIDQLIGEIEASIELLQQQRTALISAAVTGKIDVREQA